MLALCGFAEIHSRRAAKTQREEEVNSAAGAALDRVAVELVRDHARHCLTNDSVMTHGKGDKADELADAIGRML